MAGQTEHPYGVCTASQTCSVPIPYSSLLLILTESRFTPVLRVVVLSTCGERGRGVSAEGGGGRGRETRWELTLMMAWPAVLT